MKNLSFNGAAVVCGNIDWRNMMLRVTPIAMCNKPTVSTKQKGYNHCFCLQYTKLPNWPIFQHSVHDDLYSINLNFSIIIPYYI